MSSNSLYLSTGRIGVGRGRAGRLLVGALACLLALGLTCLVFVWTRGGQQLEQELLPGWRPGSGRGQQAALLEPARVVLSFAGDPVVLGALLGLALLVGALSGRWRAGLAGAGLFLASVSAARLLKLVVPRPDLGVAGSTTHNSFPSGHVAAAMSLLLVFLFVSPARARWWLAVPGMAGVAMVGAATMIAGWHRLSDVLGSVLLATALACLLAAALVASAGRRVLGAGDRGRSGRPGRQ
ncbi:phosphatase PAP2 family protein [Amycolatopsis aidingensis]|uniref:phosphatase PAP2 family protein n=1 Tax=Amycolatopsis aidingensis TaxID=2842453 RepID=UPI001C0B91E2|nr:phosphatase PAP2 family protein [Amycolatopsis aidingensis]